MPASRTSRTAKKREPRSDSPTVAQRAAFLAALRSGGSVSAACAASGIVRSTVYYLRDRDEEFATSWVQALDQGTERLEDEAVRRAVDGVEDFRLDREGVEHPFRRYSDTLLIFLLKARRPDVYRDRFEHQHTGQVALRLDRLTDGELEQLEGLVGKASE